MPYIKDEDKVRILTEKHYPNNAGELNFIITMTCKKYLEKQGECYQTYNDIMGALEGAKLEIYRRKIAVYEDKKITENGDVY